MKSETKKKYKQKTNINYFLSSILVERTIKSFLTYLPNFFKKKKIKSKIFQALFFL